MDGTEEDVSTSALHAPHDEDKSGGGGEGGGGGTGREDPSSFSRLQTRRCAMNARKEMQFIITIIIITQSPKNKNTKTISTA